MYTSLKWRNIGAFASVSTVTGKDYSGKRVPVEHSTPPKSKNIEAKTDPGAVQRGYIVEIGLDLFG